MKVYRLARKKYAYALSGKGASLSGNRWNSKGVEMIYTAESRALAMAEVLVHLPLNLLPKDYKMLCIDVPKPIEICVFNPPDIASFFENPLSYTKSQSVGDEFIRLKTYCVLKVPSAVVYGDYNYLINPFHKDFKKIRVVSVHDFPIDERLIRS